MTTMQCSHCETEFEFCADPVNAFVGFPSRKCNPEDEFTLCQSCYRGAILGKHSISINFLSYPMACRPKHMPGWSEADSMALRTRRVTPGCSEDVRQYLGKLPPRPRTKWPTEPEPKLTNEERQRELMRDFIDYYRLSEPSEANQGKPHVILLGDSIFDNGLYVRPYQSSVIEQLRAGIAEQARASLLAVDGHTLLNTGLQVDELPQDATHLVVSAGGNDALLMASRLTEATENLHTALKALGELHHEFEVRYRAMLAAVLERNLPTAVCTIYEAIPGLDPAHKTALTLFNDVILREAFRHGLDVIELRLICDQAEDFAEASPIEPSEKGSEKIAQAITVWLRQLEGSSQRERIITLR
jgi:hypothetical protein